MKDESLINSLDHIMLSLDEAEDINSLDKIEILLNIRNFLDPEHYKDNIEVLEKERIKRKYIKW